MKIQPAPSALFPASDPAGGGLMCPAELHVQLQPRGGEGKGGGTGPEEPLGLLLPLETVNQGGWRFCSNTGVSWHSRAQRGLAQHLVPVEHCLPLLLHLPLPALLRPLHPLQHCVGSGASRNGHCGQGASVLQGKEWGWRPGNAQPQHRRIQLTWGETAPERAV